jgi:integrase
MARKTLTDKGVAALKAPLHQKARYYPDPGMPGHYVRIGATGAKSYLAVVRDPNGKQKWITIGNAAHIRIDDAREKARQIIVSVKGGQSVVGPQSFQTVCEEWLCRYVDANNLISAPEIRSRLRLHVFPTFGAREFKSITRSDIASLLDRIEDNAGAVTADKVLAFLSGIFSWYTKRDDKYNSPIVRGMRRSKPKDRARERILSDDEIRAVWSHCEGTFGDLVKLLLLTAQRRDKVATMKWDDVVDGTWSVKNGVKREKGTGGDLVLPPMALNIINNRPRLGDNQYVLTGRGGSHLAGFSQGKRALDKVTGVTNWTLHDLRRTARSLMSRAGVRENVAEKVLGHVQRGVVGIYDRHAYHDEKGHALRALAGLIENILRGDSVKVRRLRG